MIIIDIKNRLMLPLFGSTGHRYMAQKGFNLGALCNFLLLFLIHMEAKYANTLNLKRLRNVRQVADMVGVHNAKARDALAALEEARLIHWFHDEGYSVNLDVFQDLLESGRSEYSCIPSFEDGFNYMTDLFFTPEKRKAQVGTMDYQEKLLALSLVISADSDGRVRDFDLEQCSHWLAISATNLHRCLERLRTTYGLILSYCVWLPLEENISHDVNRVNLNLTHSWLRYHSGFYIYCQMHCSCLMIELNSNGEENAERKLSKQVITQEAAFERFSSVLLGCAYWNWMNECKYRLISLTRNGGEFEFETCESEAEGTNKIPDMAGGWLTRKGMEQLLRHWGDSGVSFRGRWRQFYINSFSICLELVLESIKGQVFHAQSVHEIKAKYLKTLNEHPVFIRKESFSENPLKYHYLDMLRTGTEWVLGELLGEVCKALRAHPSFNASAPEALKGYLVTYLFDIRLMNSTAFSKLKEKLTGVMLIRIENRNAKDWGVETISDEQESIFEDQKYTLHWKSGDRYVPAYKHYIAEEGYKSLEPVSALVSEIKMLSPSNFSGIRDKSSIIFPDEVKGWFDFMERYKT